jgi:GT2 family glycosyltransferase
MRKRLFGMVSMQVSRQYTEVALRSFFEHTSLTPGERFILIDNDGSLSGLGDGYSSVEVVVPPNPCSFAENINYAMRNADREDADLYFLNNDLLFTPGWSEFLRNPEPIILSPFTNRELRGRFGDIELEGTMDLDSIEGKESTIYEVARRLREKPSALLAVVTFAFACVKVPREVYRAVGEFDETFGRGGAEDTDYAVRAHLAGYRVAYEPRSFVVHFNGKSTWCAESKEEEAERCAKFRGVFTEKWGADLRELLIGYDQGILSKYPEAMPLLQKGDLGTLVGIMVGNRHKSLS